MEKPKCGICGMDTTQHPKVTEQGKCDLCGQKLVMEKDCKRQSEK